VSPGPIHPAVRVFALALWLGVVWLFWSGHYDLLLLSLGAVSVAVVVASVVRMRILDDETVPVGLPGRLAVYLPWMAWRIAKANFAVAWAILRPGHLRIAPQVFTVEAGQATDLGRVIYANSITLTPGTVSIDKEGRRVTVHALTEASAAEVLDGTMDRRVTRLEGIPAAGDGGSAT